MCMGIMSEISLAQQGGVRRRLGTEGGTQQARWRRVVLTWCTGKFLQLQLMKSRPLYCCPHPCSRLRFQRLQLLRN